MNIQNWYKDKRRFNRKSKLEVKFLEKGNTFTLSLLNYQDGFPDGIIEHFGYNFYFRLPLGLRQGKYKNFNTLKKAIQKVSLKHGLTFEYLEARISAGYKYYNTKKIVL